MPPDRRASARAIGLPMPHDAALPAYAYAPHLGVPPRLHVHDRRQIIVLFVWFLALWTYGGGLLALLPVHARNLGASSSLSGAYMAIAYGALLAGGLSALWLGRRGTSRCRWMLIGSCALVVGAALMIWANRVWQLTVATALVWGSFGLTNPLGNTLVSQATPSSRQGRVFGMIGISQGLGSLIGGVTLGPAADRWGYLGMFALATGIAAIMPLTALFLHEKHPPFTLKPSRTRTRLGLRFCGLMAAAGLVTIAGYLAIMSRSLLMDDAQLGAAAISFAAAVAGSAVLAAQPLFGWLADRFGRRIVLVGNFLALALAMLVMSLAQRTLGFWLASALYGVSAARTGPVRALIGETLAPDALGTGMALFSVSFAAGAALGFGLAGSAYEMMGGGAALRWGMVLPIGAIGIVWAMGRRRHGPDVIVAGISAESQQRRP